MAGATIDGIYTRYEVYGSGPPVLMFSPGGFDATVEKWTTQGIYTQIRPIEHDLDRPRIRAKDPDLHVIANLVRT